MWNTFNVYYYMLHIYAILCFLSFSSHFYFVSGSIYIDGFIIIIIIIIIILYQANLG